MLVQGWMESGVFSDTHLLWDLKEGRARGVRAPGGSQVAEPFPAASTSLPLFFPPHPF